jgi:hypothetical protein
MILSWQQYYNLHKGTRSISEVTRDYYLYTQQNEVWEQPLLPYHYIAGGSESILVEKTEPEGFVLQENGNILLQENGNKIYL